MHSLKASLGERDIWSILSEIQWKAELDLLVHGYLEDPEVLESLRRQSYYHDWKKLRETQLIHKIDLLDDAFREIAVPLRLSGNDGGLPSPQPATEANESENEFEWIEDVAENMAYEDASHMAFFKRITPQGNLYSRNSSPSISSPSLSCGLSSASQDLSDSYDKDVSSKPRRLHRLHDTFMAQWALVHDALRLTIFYQTSRCHLSSLKEFLFPCGGRRSRLSVRLKSLKSDPIWRFDPFGKILAPIIDYTRAWKIGINVMRGLCKGEVPRAISETIIFLSTVDAISRSDVSSKSTSDQAKNQSDL